MEAIFAFVLFGGLLLVLLYAVMLYNSLVRLRNHVFRAWANIDVLLKQRHDELPNLVAVCKEYMRHEREVLEQVVRARGDVASARERRDIASLGGAETELRKGLGGLFAVAEGYPDLKADRSFRQLQERISQLETHIADRREYYNDAVNNHNTGVQQFPDALVAGLCGFGEQPLLTFEAGETAKVDLQALFSNGTAAGNG